MINSNIIPYNPKLKEFASNLRNNSTPCEISLWKQIKRRSLGVLFNRQVPILEYIVDFYCPQLHLAIEVDGNIHDFKYIEDAKRQEAIEKYGITFLRFSNQSIENDITHVISVIVAKINELKEEQESNY